MPIAARVLGIVAFATFATQALGEDDFPIVGTYTENTPCTGGGSDVSRVTMIVASPDARSVEVPWLTVGEYSIPIWTKSVQG